MKKQPFAYAKNYLCFHYMDGTIPQHFNFKLLIIFCGCTARFVSDLVGHLKTGFLISRLKLPWISERNKQRVHIGHLYAAWYAERTRNRDDMQGRDSHQKKDNSCDGRKPVFGVSDQVRLNPGCTTTEGS